MSNDVQLVFHVPMYRYDGKNLVGVNYQDFRRELIEILESHGVSTMRSEMIKENIKEHEFDEEILLVICSSDFETALVQSYVDLLIKYHKEFQHTFYVYGRNGFNHTVSIQDGKAKVV